MSVMRDILDTLKDVKSAGTDALDLTKKQRRYSSIAKRSMEGTLQFPTIVSKAIDIDTLQMTTKALERQFASFTQITLSMNPILNLATDKDAVGYLKKFHQNSNVKFNAGDFVSFIQENYVVSPNEDGTEVMYFALAEGATQTVLKDNKRQLKSLWDDLNPSILNEQFTPSRPTHHFKNASMSAYHNAVTESTKQTKIQQRYEKMRNKEMIQRIEKNKSDVDNIGLNRTKLEQDIAKSAADLDMTGLRKEELEQKIKNSGIDAVSKELGIQSTQLQMELTKMRMGDMMYPKMDYQLPNEMLKNNDAKKANELVPTTMQARVMLFDKDNRNQGTLDFVIGIKATMHPVASEEIITNMLNAVRSKNKFFDFIRWSSGEISFVKDFLFNIKEMKDDVVRRSEGSSHWWIALKRRAALSRIKSAFGTGNSILPNATIVMSMDEVEYFRSKYSFDLMDTTFINKIMHEYFLLGFVVVDNSSQLTHFMFDGQTDFQVVTFSGLERDNKTGGGGDLKDVLKLVQRV